MLTSALKTHFGFDRFRDGQEEVVEAVMAGTDVVVVMPTGSGKSLCFQLPALVLPGITLVLSPLIALMKDQVETLQRRKIAATFVNSSLDPHEMGRRLEEVRAGKHKLLYLAPERLKDPRFLKLLEQIEVSLIAVDEAHCVSQWGHDFRPDYLRIHEMTRLFPKARVAALTATATARVREDIVRHLGLGGQGRKNPRVFVHGFERPNLHIAVTRCSTHDQKLARVSAALEDWRNGIIYCSTRKQAEIVVKKLDLLGHDVPLYHGGMSDTDRSRIQDRFMTGRVNAVVATNAFGMGVDRADLRFVLHWDIPGSMEAYYQEIGRAGRDGAPAWCELLYNYIDIRTQEFFLEGSNPSRETILELLALLRRRCSKQPLALPAEVWAGEMGSTNNPMAVRSAFWILERANCIQREDEPGSRTQAVLALEKIDDRALAEHIQRAEAKAQRDRAKLDAILDFANRRECRHRQILRYFGDATDIGNACKACDVCQTQAAKPRPALSEEDWVRIQKILSTVARLDHQFGRARIAELLKGSKNLALAHAGLLDHRGHGLLSDLPLPVIVDLIDNLLADGCLEQSFGEFPTLGISARGKEAVFRRVTPDLSPVPAVAAPSAKTKSPKKSADPPTHVDGELFLRLKAWRMKRCRIAHVKPFQVLANKTLEELAAQKPATIQELQQISGIGPVKLAQYGEELLRLIQG
jgi:ATP-dependent DNA helicase RecQ